VSVLGGLAPRRRLAVIVVAGVLAVAVAMLLIRAIGSSRSSRPDGLPDQSAPGTVLLVPGYGGSVDSLATLAGKIRAQGRTATVVSLPGDGTGDLEAQAAALDNAVGAAIEHGSVDLIGYSAGGVVVRLWLARYDGVHSARRVVTLGSPLHGTSIAAAGSAFVPGACPVACQQLTPGSSLLAELNATPLPATLPWVSIWTRDDETVTPPDSAVLAGAINVELQQVCPTARIAHGQLPTDPLPVAIALTALAGPVPAAPTPGCAGAQ
jgi:triacylglycerol esterase/lipase EstA (alpha/beta hydrolase family)